MNMNNLFLLDTLDSDALKFGFNEDELPRVRRLSKKEKKKSQKEILEEIAFINKAKIYNCLRKYSDDEDEQMSLFMLIEDDANMEIDGLGNTVCHYLANPDSIPYYVSADKSWFWRKTKQKEKDSLIDWAPLLIKDLKFDCLKQNKDGLSAFDLCVMAKNYSIAHMMLNNNQFSDIEDIINAQFVLSHLYIP